MRDNAAGPSQTVLIEEAANFLRASGQSLLLDHAGEYESMPSRLLSRFLEEYMRIIERARASTIHWRTFSLAASFLSQDRMVIWDFFSPGEDDTSALSRL